MWMLMAKPMLAAAFVPLPVAAPAGRSTGHAHPASAAAAGAPTGPHPELCVFDLDACLWDKEMYEMTVVPTAADTRRGDLNGRGEGVVGVMSGGNLISLHQGSLVALQEHADGTFPGMRLALASSANTPFAEQARGHCDAEPLSAGMWLAAASSADTPFRSRSRSAAPRSRCWRSPPGSP